MVLWKFYVLKSWKMPFHVYWQGHSWRKYFFYDTLTLTNSNEEEVLGVNIDRKLTFHQDIKKICRKAGQKLRALMRLSPYLDTNKRKTIHTTMVKSQLNYCPLVCMFYLRRLLLLSSLLSSRYVIFMSSIMSSLFEIRENTHNTR